MQTFFFPLMWLIPDFEGNIIEGNGFSVHKRKWEVPIFDLYSLVAKKHPLCLPAELMHVFLGNVNSEIEILSQDFVAARDLLDCVRLLLYVREIMPTISPFASNLSINTYAGINDRSAGLQHKMHEGLREGVTHETDCIETWPNELVFSCIQGPAGSLSRKITAEDLQAVSRDLKTWCELESCHHVLRAARKALVKSPLMPDLGSSILQVWQGIESLFPSVNTEVTFRTSMLLAMLISRVDDKDKVDIFKKSKKSYSDRSRIAHGSQAEVSIDQWIRAWSLLRDAVQSIILWNRLPDEDELTTYLIAGGTF